MRLEFLTRDEEETKKLGKNLASILKEGDVISLSGELGSGKTVFVKGLAEGLKAEEEVTSPSFVLLNIYPGRIKLYHFDLYRITAEEFWETVGGDFFYEDGVVVLEWGEKVEKLLPSASLKVKFERGEKEKERKIIFDLGPEWEKRLESLND
jgi:tRNA threonylcarbamoyladenosine biosynthesis protein TsaE